MHDLQLTQFAGHSADFQATISWLTIKLSQLKIMLNTDSKPNGLYGLTLSMYVSTVDLTVTYYIGQIYRGEFAKMCGLLRIYELYIWNIIFLGTRKYFFPLKISSFLTPHTPKTKNQVWDPGLRLRICILGISTTLKCLQYYFASWMKLAIILRKKQSFEFSTLFFCRVFDKVWIPNVVFKYEIDQQ